MASGTYVMGMIRLAVDCEEFMSKTLDLQGAAKEIVAANADRGRTFDNSPSEQETIEILRRHGFVGPLEKKALIAWDSDDHETAWKALTLKGAADIPLRHAARHWEIKASIG